MVMRIIRWIISIFTKHKRGVIAGAAGLGAAGAGAGLFNAHKAKKINRQALDIQQAALERHEQAYHPRRDGFHQQLYPRAPERA